VWRLGPRGMARNADYPTGKAIRVREEADCRGRGEGMAGRKRVSVRRPIKSVAYGDHVVWRRTWIAREGGREWPVGNERRFVDQSKTSADHVRSRCSPRDAMRRKRREEDYQDGRREEQVGNRRASVDQSKVWRPGTTWWDKGCGFLDREGDKRVNEWRGGELPGREREWPVGKRVNVHRPIKSVAYGGHVVGRGMWSAQCGKRQASVRAQEEADCQGRTRGRAGQKRVSIDRWRRRAAREPH
jgi:hypothetical protein